MRLDVGDDLPDLLGHGGVERRQGHIADDAEIAQPDEIIGGDIA